MEETTAGGANTSAAAAVVNEFPPPPIYYKDFSNENLHLIPGPPIPPSTIETYGGMISPPFLITENEQDKQQQALPSHLLPNQLKELLKEFIHQTLSYANDENRIESIENGAANLDIFVNRIYELLYQYRIHEARENICIYLRNELQQLNESKEHLQRVYSDAKSALEGS